MNGVLAGAVPAQPAVVPAARPRRLVIAVQMGQDIDLALPLLRCALAAGWPVAVLLRESAQGEERVRASLAGCGADIVAVADAQVAVLARSLLRRDDAAFVAVVESNLRPHAFGHALTQVARDKGLPTFTLQHGFENIGLSYTDTQHPIGSVSFASDRIFTWGGPGTLHPGITPEARAKCIPVGCIKPATVAAAPIPALQDAGRPVIGIFENLHWGRFSDSYRQFFLDGVKGLAEASPQYLFLVKPHHAGRWLTQRYKGERPRSDNLLVADPLDPAWSAWTAPQMFGYMAAVITTPSTVALDAARCGLPVAVVAEQLPLDNYDPLVRLRQATDWQAFAGEALTSPARLRTLGGAFCDRVLLPGEAAPRILQHIAAAQRSRPLWRKLLSILSHD